MSVISKPVINAPLSTQPPAVNTQPAKVLFVGQMTSVGTATPGSLVSNIQNDGSESVLFGANSILAEMVRAYKFYNTVTQLDCIPLDDAGGADAAEGTIIFTGPATETGSLIVTIGSTHNYQKTLSITNGDSATTIAANLAALFNSDTKVPVTLSALTGTATITAVNAGTVGNAISIKIEGTVAGVGFTLTGMSGGATNPTMTGIFNVTGDVRYQHVSMPYEYGVSNLQSFLDPRFNVNNAILDGVGILTHTDSFSNLIAIGNPLNDQNIVIFGNNAVDNASFVGSACLELDYNASAQIIAIRALRLTLNANISNYVVTSSANDQLGGPGISALPYQNTPLINLPVIDANLEFTMLQMDQLNTAGISVFGNNPARNGIILGSVVTTYKTSANGVPDPNFKYLNQVDESVTAREIFFNRAKQRFAQTRLTTGAIPAGRAFVNIASLRSFFIQTYSDLAGSDFAITVLGEDALNYYKQNLNVQIISVPLGQVLASMKLPLVSQLREIDEPIVIVFDTSGG